jgi:hypothetical protein
MIGLSPSPGLRVIIIPDFGLPVVAGLSVIVAHHIPLSSQTSVVASLSFQVARISDL